MNLVLPIFWWMLLGLNPGVEPKEKQLIFSDDFSDSSRFEQDYWVESSGQAFIRNSKLHFHTDGSYGTIWLNQQFEGDLMIEYEAHVVHSSDTANNMNLFFHYQDPDGALPASASTRSEGKYRLYHQLQGYIFTFVANGNPDLARFRLRDNPGFHLLDENNTYHCRIGRTYHFRIEKNGSQIKISVDGIPFLNYYDDSFNPVHEKGFIGFRTWHTDLWWDNLKIYQL
ncbi:MAG: DUF1961 family protein [Candidatus Cyclobacteriaceae bacterium M3_2C_046]